MAELRKQALLASGVQIEGLLQGPGSGPPAAKKVVYGNRKKKGTPTTTKDGLLAPESRPRSPDMSSEAPSPGPSPAAELPPDEKVVNGDAKSDWEASSDEDEGTKPEVSSGVKGSWDESSEAEETSEWSCVKAIPFPLYILQIRNRNLPQSDLPPYQRHFLRKVPQLPRLPLPNHRCYHPTLAQIRQN